MITAGPTVVGPTAPSISALLAGPAGEDAFAIAVDSGYTGTRSQWLASLVGQPGPTGSIGPAGPPNIIGIGTVQTGSPGSAAAAAVRGASPTQFLDLTIPTGQTGPTGSVPWQTPPTPWAASTVYSASAPASSVTYGGGSYVCSTNHTSGATFDASKWAQIAAPGAASAGALIAGNNLSDVANPRIALTNLGLAGSPVRQTVQSGPTASGAPSFLPTNTSGTLSLAFQNVSPTNPLIITGAKGFDAAGAINQVAIITSNPSVMLPASQSYVGGYWDLDLAAWGTSTLVPIYQFGGAISTVNGQYTFDYLAMIGWVGNGTAAIRANRVYVFEAATSSTSVTSTIAYAYNGLYDSGFAPGLPAANTIVTKNSNLGLPPGVPRVSEVLFQNLTTEFGFAVGDVLSRPTGYQSASSISSAAAPIQNRNTVRLVGPPNGWIVLTPSAQTISTLTNANWAYKITDRRAF